MKHTLLSKGAGFYFPPCHMLHLCGFRILLECPIDLSALTIFHPVSSHSYQTPEDDSFVARTESSSLDSREKKKRKVEKPLVATDLMPTEPWFRMVTNLNLWDITFVDVVLISSPMGMLGLPFLTRHKNFSAKVYATEATTRIGQLMMEDLVSMHMEYRQFYGPEESKFPKWMKWEELELLPDALKEIVMGHGGAKLGSWQPIYSAADVKCCIQKVQTLKYAEETCYNGTLVIKALSSGLEIGACNWTIIGPRQSLTYLSSSIFVTGHATSFDFHSLQGSDLILFSDFSSLNGMIDISNDVVVSQSSDAYHVPTSNDFTDLRKVNATEQGLISSLTNNEENSEEMDKIAFICSCTVESVKRGGSVLIPVGRVGIVLQLLEQISLSLESTDIEVPIFMISSVAEEMLAFTNVIPEWLCKQRQENLYCGEALFGHVDLIKRKKLHLFPAVHSTDFIEIWQEPCIIFAPHWSLRLGPVVHLLQRWCMDPNSLLVLEEEVDTDLALLPFKPMEMKVLQCSFLSGIKTQKIGPLLEFLRPKLVLFPKAPIMQQLTPNTNSYSLLGYSENETLSIPSLRENFEVIMSTDLAFQLKPKITKQENIAVARLEAKLVLHHGKHLLVSAKEPLNSSTVQMPLQWGCLDPELLLVALQKMGISGIFNQDRNVAENNVICIDQPYKASIEMHAKHTVISAMDENVASILFEAINSVLDSI